MDEKIQKFLEEAELGLDAKTYNVMVKDATSLDTRGFIDKYLPLIQKDKGLALAAKSLGLDKYSKDKWTRYSESFGSSDKENPFKKDAAWLKATWQTEFPDIDYETFIRDVNSMAKHWEDEVKSRHEKAGKKRRTKEVENEWPWYKKMLANEYSQARYIDDPNSTPFGKEGSFDPWNNKLELANIGLQGASLVGDAIPGGWGYLAGPGVRAVNDFVQEAGDYGKGAGDIVRDRLFDLSTSFLGDAGPNTILRTVGRSEKLGKGLARGIEETADYAALMKEVKETNSLMEAWKKEPSFARRQKIIEKMPDNYLKTTLKNLDSPGYTLEQLQKMDIPQLKLIPQEEAAVKAQLDEIIDEGAEGGKFSKEYEWNKKIGDTPEPGTFGKKLAAVSISPVAQGAKAVVSRDLAKAGGKQVYDKKPESENDRKVKDWYKKQYSRMWDANFRPKEDSGLLYEAWKEYKGIE